MAGDPEDRLYGRNPVRELLRSDARRADEVWWWAWAFAVLSAGLATLCIGTAAFGITAGSAPWPWWALGLGHLVFGALDLLGLSDL